MPLPTFIVIGVAKAGTTSIYEYAKQHPDIHMSPTKETNYFATYGEAAGYTGPGDSTLVNRTSIHRREDYEAQFTGARPGAALGEASPRYMFDTRVPARIHHDIPDARLVVALRHPVDRAYAQWAWARMSARETLPFDEAIELGDERFEAGWGWGSYLKASRYADQLERYYSLFDREQLHVHLFEDFTGDTVGVMQQMFTHVGVDPAFEPDVGTAHYGSGVIQNRAARRAWDASFRLRELLRPIWPVRLRNAAFRFVTRSARKPVLDPDLRRTLTDRFRPDIERTSELIERDLSHWLD